MKRPIVTRDRIVGLDVARALALLGMMATHILPGVAPDGQIPVAQQVAGGRASALFAVLAGVSLALMSGRTTPERGRRRLATSAGLAVRALIIAAIGLALGGLGSGIAVILTYYGLLFLLAIPFMGLGARALGLLSAAWLVAAPVASHLLRPHLPAPSYESPTFDDLTAPSQLLTELSFTGYYPVLPWLAYVLAGMAVGRLALSRARVAFAVVLVGAGAAALSVAVSDYLLAQPGVRRTLMETFEGPGGLGSLEATLTHGLYGTTPTGSWWWLAVDTPHTATPFDLAHTIGTSLLAIGVCVLAARVVPSVWAVAFGAGAMTLTLYSLHVFLRSPDMWDGDTLEVYLGQVALVMVIGAGYRLARRSGPLEALVARAQDAVRTAAGPRPRR